MDIVTDADAAECFLSMIVAFDYLYMVQPWLSCQISIAEQWKPVIFHGLNTAHFIFTILKGQPRNTWQMFRADQIKCTAFRLQNTFSSFAMAIC